MSKLDYVLDLGGSIVNPGTLNAAFLHAFRDFIVEYVARGMSFAIIVGGGSVARTYQDFLRQNFQARKDDLDMVGVRATKLNSELVRIILQPHTYSKILEDPYEELLDESDAKVFLFSGWKTGWSTDYVAVIMAKRFGVSEVLCLSNIPGVYALENGNINTDRLLPILSWSQYERMAGDTWVPGMKVPFDPIATREAKAQGLRVVVMQGEDLENVRRYLERKEFRGTVIE